MNETTTTETITGLEVCTDCAMFIANGETPERLGEFETAAWLEDLDDSPGHWVIGAETTDFCTAQCDHCNSTLAGARYSAAII